MCPDTDGSLHANVVCPVNVTEQPGRTLPDIQIAAKAVKTIRDVSARNEPFFLAVGFHKPHIPLKYPKQYDSKFSYRSVKVLPAMMQW